MQRTNKTKDQNICHHDTRQQNNAFSSLAYVGTMERSRGRLDAYPDRERLPLLALSPSLSPSRPPPQPSPVLPTVVFLLLTKPSSWRPTHFQHAIAIALKREKSTATRGKRHQGWAVHQRWKTTRGGAGTGGRRAKISWRRSLLVRTTYAFTARSCVPPRRCRTVRSGTAWQTPRGPRVRMARCGTTGLLYVRRCMLRYCVLTQEKARAWGDRIGSLSGCDVSDELTGARRYTAGVFLLLFHSSWQQGAEKRCFPFDFPFSALSCPSSLQKLLLTRNPQNVPFSRRK